MKKMHTCITITHHGLERTSRIKQELPFVVKALTKKVCHIMIRTIAKIFVLVAVLAGSVSSESPDSKTCRHCSSFEEKNVDSTFDGVGEVFSRTYYTLFSRAKIHFW
jgi:hypothetical protein